MKKGILVSLIGLTFILIVVLSNHLFINKKLSVKDIPNSELAVVNYCVGHVEYIIISDDLGNQILDSDYGYILKKGIEYQIDALIKIQVIPEETCYIDYSFNGYNVTFKNNIDIYSSIENNSDEIRVEHIHMGGYFTIDDEAHVGDGYGVVVDGVNGRDIGGLIGEQYIEVTSSVNKEYVKKGDEIEYTFTLTNKGDYKASQVILTDTFDFDALDIVSDSEEFFVENNMIYFNPILDLEPNQTLTYKIKAKAKENIANTKINNTLKAIDEDDNEVVASSTITYTEPKINLNLTSSNEKVKANETFYYTINLSNESFVSSYPISLTSTLSEDLEIINADGGTINNNTIAWSYLENKIEPNGTLEIKVEVKAKENLSDGTILTNTLNLKTENETLDTKTDVTISSPKAEVSIKSDKETLVAGDQVTYIIEVKNSTNEELKNILVEYTLSDQLIMKEAALGTINNNKVEFLIESLSPNSIQNFTVIAEVKKDSEVNSPVQNEIVVNEDGLITNKTENNVISEIENPDTSVNSVLVILVFGIITLFILKKLRIRNNFYKI